MVTPLHQPQNAMSLQGEVAVNVASLRKQNNHDMIPLIHFWLVNDWIPIE